MLRWLCGKITLAAIEVRWADLRGVPNPPMGLGERLTLAVELYPCRLLFVHRDAENQEPRLRYEEIWGANGTGCSHVCVVPVRMQGAWLLHNADALRRAAGRPSSTAPLELPTRRQWEALPDPKGILHQALRTASGATGRRAKKFSPEKAAHRLADLIDDWSPLRQLPAFQLLEADTRAALVALDVPPASDFP
ncbi:MAG: hypothetical protein EXR72_00625 [Myxococcales bacterium]|nr:hypothetical protein [Myxococcales bacterium]